MNSSNGKGHLWHQVKIIALLPVTIPLWLVGWALYCVGDNRTLPDTAEKKNITAFEKEERERNNAEEEAPKQLLK
jgi:hypothetical protein